MKVENGYMIIIYETKMFNKNTLTNILSPILNA